MKVRGSHHIEAELGVTNLIQGCLVGALEQRRGGTYSEQFKCKLGEACHRGVFRLCSCKPLLSLGGIRLNSGVSMEGAEAKPVPGVGLRTFGKDAPIVQCCSTLLFHSSHDRISTYFIRTTIRQFVASNVPSHSSYDLVTPVASNHCHSSI